MIDETVSHFRITDEIGRGANGVVYRAMDDRLQRAVAIKVLAAGVSEDPQAPARFLKEARVASSIDHPHIGTIFEAGQTAEGQLYLAMAYYGGGSLRERIERGRLEPEDAADLIMQIGSGLARAHAHAIVHGDIKPENILFADDGSAKIIDFGVARFVGAEIHPGIVTGTVTYMAPEQIAGQDIGPQADVFALGLLFYELLSGQRAFAGDYEAAVRYSLTHEQPPALATYGVTIDPRWQAVLDKAMAKNPAERWADGAEFVDALAVARDAQVGEPPDRARRRSRRRMLAGIAAGVLAVVLGVVVGPRLVTPPRPTGEQALAVIEFKDLVKDSDPTLVEAMCSLIQVGLVQNSPVRVVSPDFIKEMARRLAGDEGAPVDESQALELARRAGASLMLTGQLARLDGKRLVTWRLVETAGGQSVAAGRAGGDDLAGIADGIITEVVQRVRTRTGQELAKPTAPVASLTTENPQAYRYYISSKLTRDGYQIDDAIHQLETAVQLDSTFALALLDLSEIYYSGTAAGVDFGRARELADRAWRHRDRLGVKDRMRLEAWMARLDYRIDHARDVLRELHTRWPDDRGILEDLHNLLFYFWWGDEALEVAATGLRLYPDDDLHFGLFYQIGLEQTGQYAEALKATRAYLGRHPLEPNAWDELGWRFLSVGEPDSAEWAYRKALDIDNNFFPSYQGLAYAAYARGDLDGAVGRADDLLARPELLPGQRVQVLTDNVTWPGLAVFYAEAGHVQDALSVYDRATAYLTDDISRLRSKSSWASVELRVGHAAAVLAWVDSLRTLTGGIQDPSLARLAQNYTTLYGALALAMSDSLDAARALVPQLQSLVRGMGGQATFYARKVGIKIALAEHDPQTALRLLDENAAQILPPGGLIAIEHYENRARAYMLAGKTREALAALDFLQRVYKGDKRALALRGEVLEAAGRDTAAVAAYRAFLDAWQDADPGLPLVARVQARVAVLAGS